VTGLKKSVWDSGWAWLAAVLGILAIIFGVGLGAWYLILRITRAALGW